MEVKLLSKSGIPDDAVLSIRKGNVRRQAQLDAGRFPFRFPTGLMEDNPLRIDILVQVGSGFLVMKPGDQRYKVTTGEASMVELELSETDGKSAKAAGEQRKESQDPIVAKASAKGAKEYLEHHGIFSFVQAVLQAVIEDQPSDPYRFMARLFLDGGYRDFTTTSQPKEPKQTKEEAPDPSCDSPPAPPPAQSKTELLEAPTAKADPPPASALADEGTGHVPDVSLKSLPASQSPEDLESTPEPSGPGAAPPPAEAEAKKEPEPAEVAEAVQASEPPQAPAVAKTEGPDALADRATEPVFEHLPSVGAWLTPLLARPLQAPNAAPAETPEVPAEEAPAQEVPEPTENFAEAAVVEAPKEEPLPEPRKAEVVEDTATKEETEPPAVEVSMAAVLVESASDPAPLPTEPKSQDAVQSESKDAAIAPEPASSATERGVAPGARQAELDQAVQVVAQALQKMTAEVPAPEQDLQPAPRPSKPAEERSSGEPKQMPDAPAPVQREPIFEHLPSVGAWLTPLLASPLQDASPAEHGAAASLRREPVFEHLPSVGAWLTPLLASPLQMRLAASDLGANAEAPVARQDSFFPPAWPAAIERRPPPPEAKEMDLNVLSTHPAGPKYSMAPLIGKKSGSDEVGPGKYAEVKAEQDKYSKPPCWSIGNPAKDGLWGADSKDPDKLETAEIDESGVPGPGQYFPVDQSPYSPKFGFGSRRKDPKPATCPGPGQYELKSTLQGKSGPSWGKPPPDSGRGKGKDGKSTEPGPGEFSPNSSITSRSAPAIGFSASNREKASVSDSPGPGQYDLATTLTGGAVVIRSPTSASIKEEDNTIAGPGPPTSSFRSFSSR